MEANDDRDDGGSSLSTASSLSSGSHRGKRRRSSPSARRKRRRGDRNRAAADAVAAPATSDYEELRRHFQFVLPDEQDGGERFGSTWQERMVKNYHAKLFKEYVLTDLSRALETGQVGMRWRTEGEVVSGIGHRTCGNLACRIHERKGTSDDEGAREREEEYKVAARRHIGIGVPEVGGGRDPVGVLLPPDQSRGEKLREYLSSCAREHRRDEEGGKSERRHKSKKRKRRRKHSTKDNSEDRERREERRLAKVPHGLGLHDYEVDFAYRERGERKRELVKARLCLRCAPLLFVSKLRKGGGGGRGGEGMAPAIAAREARERAARASVRSDDTGVP